MATKLIESALVISGQDKTDKAFAAISGKLDRLIAAGKRVNNLGRQFVSFSGQVAGVNQQLNLMHAHLNKIAGMSLGQRIGKIGSMVGLTLAGTAAVHAFIAATAKGQHERVRMEAAGIRPEEIGQAEARSAELSTKYPAVSQTDILHWIRNARSITGSFEEAMHVLDPMLGAYVVAMGSHPDKAAELKEEFDKLLKGQEIVGATQNMPRFIENMDLLAKAMNVFGDTLKPEEFYNFAKYARAAGPGLSDKFLMGVAPTLMQEMGGKSAGEAIASFYTQFVSGTMPLQTARELMKYGLIDPKKIEYTKAGLLKKLLPGAVKGSDLARSDPFAWVNEVMIPALRKHGLSDEQIAKIVPTFGSKRTTAQWLGIAATQQARILKDLRLEQGAQGLEAAPLFLHKDPYVAFQAVTAQTQNFLQVVGSPEALNAAKTLADLADSIASLTGATRSYFAPSTKPGESALAQYGIALAHARWSTEEPSGYWSTFLGPSPFGTLQFAPRRPTWGPFSAAGIDMMIKGGEEMPWYYKWLPTTWAAEALLPHLRRIKEGGGLYDDLWRTAGKPVEVTGEAAIKVEVEVKPPPGWGAEGRTFGARVPLRGTTGEVGQGMPDVQTPVVPGL
jgi:hypothetical protein